MRIFPRKKKTNKFHTILLEYPEVSEDVDIKDLLDLLRLVSGQRVTRHDTSVVNQHCDITNLLSYLLRHGQDRSSVGDITPVDTTRESKSGSAGT